MYENLKNQSKLKIKYIVGPFLTNVATIKAVLNSAFAINKYLKSNEVSILNAVGEFEFAKKLKNIKILNF